METKDIAQKLISKEGLNKLDKERELFERAYCKLVTVTCVSSFFIVCQCFGGYMANSIAIFTDTAHLATDLIGFMMSMYAMKISLRKASNQYTFGWHRSEIIGSLASVTFMLTLTAVLVYLAVGRCVNPQPVKGVWMFGVGCMCCCFNLIQMKILHQGETAYHPGESLGAHDHGPGGHSHEGGDDDHGHDHQVADDDKESQYSAHSHEHTHDHDHNETQKKNINLDAAFLHALGDMLMSVGVVVAGTIIWIEPTWTYADPCCTFIFSISVLCTTGPILRKCMLVLMEGAPPSIDAKELIKEIKRITKCRSIHDFHIWSISNNKYAISAHIDCDDVLKNLKLITLMLKEKFDIDHITLQMEDSSTDNPDQFLCEQTTHQQYDVNTSDHGEDPQKIE